MIKTILIICIGNICRSPMAEALFAEKFKQGGLDIGTLSAGLGAMVDRPADAVARTLMLEHGLDISSHRAQQVTPHLLLASDLILTMDCKQQNQIECISPGIRGRVHRIGKWGEYDIPDPYKRPKAAFEQVFFLIEQSVNDWYKKLWN